MADVQRPLLPAEQQRQQRQSRDGRQRQREQRRRQQEEGLADLLHAEQAEKRFLPPAASAAGRTAEPRGHCVGPPVAGDVLVQLRAAQRDRTEQLRRLQQGELLALASNQDQRLHKLFSNCHFGFHRENADNNDVYLPFFPRSSRFQ